MHFEQRQFEEITDCTEADQKEKKVSQVFPIAKTQKDLSPDCCLMCNKPFVEYRRIDLICDSCRPKIKESRPTRNEMDEILNFLPSMKNDEKKLDAFLAYIRSFPSQDSFKEKVLEMLKAEWNEQKVWRHETKYEADIVECELIMQFIDEFIYKMERL